LDNRGKSGATSGKSGATSGKSGATSGKSGATSSKSGATSGKSRTKRPVEKQQGRNYEKYIHIINYYIFFGLNTNFNNH
jgi:hypothetical protein